MLKQATFPRSQGKVFLLTYLSALHSVETMRDTIQWENEFRQNREVKVIRFVMYHWMGSYCVFHAGASNYHSF
jgi:hypothetical protein